MRAKRIMVSITSTYWKVSCCKRKKSAFDEEKDNARLYTNAVVMATKRLTSHVSNIWDIHGIFHDDYLEKGKMINTNLSGNLRRKDPLTTG